jgi:hypothetical protein
VGMPHCTETIFNYEQLGLPINGIRLSLTGPRTMESNMTV